jgi:hypothetical protein
MVVHRITGGELGVGFQHLPEPADGAQVMSHPEVGEADAIAGLAQAVLRVAHQRARLGHQRAVRVPIQEDLELLDRVAGRRLVAIGREHLLGVGFRESKLRVVRTWARRVKRQKFTELIDRQQQ